MDYDTDKVDDAVLALLHLTKWRDKFQVRAWKGHDWAAMERLYEKGYIGDPKSKAKFVGVTEVDEARARELFHKLFGKSS
jgi:hypothetical protein